MNPEVENQIRNNVMWVKLPANVKQVLGNSQKEYEKSIVSYCIRNQARFKNSLVKQVRRDEKKYYEELLEYSREHYMLYPYHLSDIIIRGFRITPFNYYLDMMANLMTLEKSYDTLPNFTAFDCVRLLGIGRNQYIDIMNKYRSSAGSSKFRSIGFTRRKPIKSLLPMQPCDILVEPWWLINVGCITDDDIKLLEKREKEIIDLVIDLNKPVVAGTVDFDCVHSLYKKGLIYLEVALAETDFVEVPPLEGFVMNRIIGDYFETLLYKLFVSIDDRTSLGELASLLEIDVESVLNAVSLYCRLSFAKKKPSAQSAADEAKYNPSWLDYKSKSRTSTRPNKETTVSLLEWNNDQDSTESSRLFSESADETGSAGGGGQIQRPSVSSLSINTDPTSNTTPTSLSSPQQPTSSIVNNSSKRIGFLFDSTLTAFLMMGNLSSGLKNHAVTMFEVGKLTDQALDSFLVELDKVSKESNEGEAQRYFDHALILKSTIQFLRNNSDLKMFSGYKSAAAVENGESTNKTPIEDEPMALDLLRCESLSSLDEDSRQRILAKNYTILFSMAPYSSSGESINSPPVTFDSPYHLGPAVPEVNSIWFKLYLYQLVQDGPVSLFLPKGYRLSHLPESFKYYDKFMIITWGHDPIINSHYNLLLTLNEALSHGPILVQCYAESDEPHGGGCTVHVAFNDHSHPLFKHPSVQKLHEKLGLKHFVGYLTMLNMTTSSSSNSSGNGCTDVVDLGDEVNLDEWTLLDVRFGVPLFDTSLNKLVLARIKQDNLACVDNLNKMLEYSRVLSADLHEFIQKNQTIDIVDKSSSSSLANAHKQTSLFNVTESGSTTSSSLNNFNNHLFGDVNNYLIASYNNSKSIKKSVNNHQANVVLYPTQCVLFESGQIRVESF